MGVDGVEEWVIRNLYALHNIIIRIIYTHYIITHIVPHIIIALAGVCGLDP